jgi:hypothetical protein
MRRLWHLHMRHHLALCVCLLALGWTAAASAAETACRVVGTMKFEVGKTVCIPSARDTWLVCTDVSTRPGGGAWKDTGVPCNQTQPKSPADYRAVPEGPHPTATPVEAKRVIDMFRGIVFRCLPSTHLSWSADACARITAELVNAAKSAGVSVVVIDALDDEAAKAKKAEAEGLKLDDAIDWVVLLRATDTGGAIFKQDINGVTEVVSGIYDRRPLLLASDAYLQPATAEQALAEAKTDFAGDFQYLTQPR